MSLPTNTFLLHLRHHAAAIAPEHDDVVDVGAVADELVFFQAVANEAAFAVDVQFLIGSGHHVGGNGVERPDFGFSVAALAVLFLKVLVIRNGEPGDVSQMIVRFYQFRFQPTHEFIGLEGIVLGNAFDADFGQPQNIILHDLPIKLLSGRVSTPCRWFR